MCQRTRVFKRYGLPGIKHFSIMFELLLEKRPIKTFDQIYTLFWFWSTHMRCNQRGMHILRYPLGRQWSAFVLDRSNISLTFRFPTHLWHFILWNRILQVISRIYVNNFSYLRCPWEITYKNDVIILYSQTWVQLSLFWQNLNYRSSRKCCDHF